MAAIFCCILPPVCCACASLINRLSECGKQADRKWQLLFVTYNMTLCKLMTLRVRWFSVLEVYNWRLSTVKFTALEQKYRTFYVKTHVWFAATGYINSPGVRRTRHSVMWYVHCTSFVPFPPWQQALCCLGKFYCSRKSQTLGMMHFNYHPTTAATVRHFSKVMKFHRSKKQTENFLLLNRG